jgi:hypothetical protein
MATLTKALARTAAATSSTTLYTVPSSTTAVVSNIVVTNTASSFGNAADYLGEIAVSNLTFQ